MIHRDLLGGKHQYLLPAPLLFIRPFLFSFFAQIIENSSDAYYGEAFEDHIGDALKFIFRECDVERIVGTTLRADFIIRHPSADIIIEVKTSIGSYEAQSIMSPEDIQKIWDRFYKATIQCAASAKALARPEQPIVCISLLGDHITGEAMPFIDFAERSGIFAELEICGVQFISWNALEHALANLSTTSFVDALVKKMLSTDRSTIATPFRPTGEGPPAHAYEYLEATYQELFPHRMGFIN